MNNQNTMYYITNDHKHIELVLCKDSLKSYPLHNHVSVYTIGYILSGALELQTSTGTHKYKKDTYFFLEPYTPHAIKALQPYSMLTICIHKASFSQMDSSSMYTDIAKLLCHINIFDHTQQKRILATAQNIINNIFCHVATYPSAGNSIINQLELRPEEKMSIEEMAQKSYMSKYQFIRNFKRDVGLTPHQFQIQNQVRKAQKALCKAENITEVALNSGFYDQSHFIRHFEKVVRLTPSEYKLCCQIITDSES